MNPITAYNGKATDYAAHRLPYAPEIVTAILELTGLDSTCDMADIAAGTGLVSNMFAGHVQRIVAVEPNDEMREQATRLLHADPTFQSVAGTAEDSTLPDASVDLITVGQAWHWFDPQAAACEFARILRPEGWVVIIWNAFPHEGTSDFFPLFAPGEAKEISFPIAFAESWEQYIGGTRSAAAAPSLADPAYSEFEEDQRETFDSRAVDGILTVEYRTEIRAGRLNRRTR